MANLLFSFSFAPISTLTDRGGWSSFSRDLSIAESQGNRQFCDHSSAPADKLPNNKSVLCSGYTEGSCSEAGCSFLQRVASWPLALDYRGICMGYAWPCTEELLAVSRTSLIPFGSD